VFTFVPARRRIAESVLGLADGIEGLKHAQNNPSGAGEQCSAAYDRVPGRQGLFSNAD
jgi:hypothetical protein